MIKVLKYLFFGVSTTCVNWVIYLLCTKIFAIGMTTSNALAWGGAVIFAFITNKIWVFESKSLSLVVVSKELISFVGARILSGILEIFLPTFLFSIGLNQSFFGIEGFWAKVSVSVLVIVLNYVLSKWIVFKHNE